MVLLFSLRDRRSASSMPLFTPEGLTPGMRIKLSPITSHNLHPGFDNPVKLSILAARFVIHLFDLPFRFQLTCFMASSSSLLGEPAFHFCFMSPY
jgi:hypothetical protein